MTKPRLDTQREICGLLGRWLGRATLLQVWNSWFTERGVDAVLLHYPASVDMLPERLSEMFHFDRRLYLVSKELQEAVVPLLDSYDESVKKHRRAVLILNHHGVLQGHWIDERMGPEEVWCALAPSNRHMGKQGASQPFPPL